MNPAQHSRLEKEAHPELYCPKCLWKTGGGFCPRHTPPGCQSTYRGWKCERSDPNHEGDCSERGVRWTRPEIVRDELEELRQSRFRQDKKAAAAGGMPF